MLLTFHTQRAEPWCSLEKPPWSNHSGHPRLKKLLQINRATGIETRASVINYGADLADLEYDGPPSISDLDALFRDSGVKLAVQACSRALGE